METGCGQAAQDGTWPRSDREVGRWGWSFVGGSGVSLRGSGETVAPVISTGDFRVEFRTEVHLGTPEALLGHPKSRVHSDGRLVWVKREVQLEVTIQELVAIKASNLKVWPWQNLGQQPGNPQH